MMRRHSYAQHTIRCQLAFFSWQRGTLIAGSEDGKKQSHPVQSFAVYIVIGQRIKESTAGHACSVDEEVCEFTLKLLDIDYSRIENVGRLSIMPKVLKAVGVVRQKFA